MMLRVLAISLAIFAAVMGPGAATIYSPASPPEGATTTDLPASNPSNASQPSPTSPDSPNSSVANEDGAAEAALLTSINENRKQAGVAPLRAEETLRQAARVHAQRMVASQELEHQFSGELALLQRIAAVSPLPCDRAGENIANATTAETASDTLMHSPPHRANILDARFNAVGVAAIWTNGRLYVVQDFAHALQSYSTEQARKAIGDAVSGARQSAGLSELAQFAPPHLDETACDLASGGQPNARLVGAAYTAHRVVTYTQSRPEILPASVHRVLEDPKLSHFAIGSCYARNQSYPTGMYYIALLLY